MRRNMPEKATDLWQFLTELAPWLTTFLLSVFATFAQYAAKVRQKNRQWVWRELLLDGVICVFVGFLTHLLCEWQQVEGVARSVLVAISAHMGTRAMMQYERIRDRVLGGVKE